MVKYFGIMSLDTKIDGYVVKHKFEVNCQNLQEAWNKVEKWKRDNNVSGIIFGMSSKDTNYKPQTN